MFEYGNKCDVFKAELSRTGLTIASVPLITFDTIKETDVRLARSSLEIRVRQDDGALYDFIGAWMLSDKIRIDYNEDGSPDPADKIVAVVSYGRKIKNDTQMKVFAMCGILRESGDYKQEFQEKPLIGLKFEGFQTKFSAVIPLTETTLNETSIVIPARESSVVKFIPLA